ncbi:glycosyltransferase family 2 protein [Bacillus sp. B-jedd]|uniref:glycosyltransferase family 2 protein n=1 Tax=Bacillus sp. B-jedd TaxID=1476857 RepID=UPI0005155DE2|nr:glycosyltransferase [Bacillus sp. B-jedd]CEG28649.1 glycosyl transferase family protein [Bacillus sp. B-jedd]
MKIKISVIVPIYNVEEYLRRCIDSICHQSYKNLEIILVNDGSTDSCPIISDEYKDKDNRIKIIHKQNGGLSDARNVGIEHATGDYISFVDSDDYIAENMLEVLINLCLEKECDISVCGVVRKYSDREISISSDIEEVIDHETAFKYLIQGKYFHDYAWNKLYKSELFTDITYPVGKIYEDVFTTYKLFAKANKIGFTDRPLYFYVQRDGSILRRGFHLNQFHQLEALNEIEMFITINKKYHHLQETLDSRILNVKCRLIFDILVDKILNSSASFDASGRKLLKEIKTNGIQKIKNQNIHPLSKMIVVLSMFGFNSLVTLIKTPIVKSVIMKRKRLL